MPKKRFLIAKLLRIHYVRRLCKLPHECEDIIKNPWRTPLNAQGNIEYRLQYSLFFTFLNYHRNRLFLYSLVNYRMSIISLLFWLSIPNPDRRPLYSGMGVARGARPYGGHGSPNPSWTKTRILVVMSYCVIVFLLGF